ncbi:MAG: choice-of-anchor B family protein [Candidatus Promineifilaceae bacterium]|nr:choice-of-anchor B family protein [Candidatus Promineifilaceae bacterium]
MIRTRSRRPLLAMAAILLFLLLAGSAAAHPEGPAHHKVLPPHATEVMRAFWLDQQAPQNLEAASSSNCVDGMAGIYPCHNVDLLAFMPLADIGGTSSNSSANDIWGWTDPQTGKEYAIIGRVFGTSFVDISDPTNPLYLGELPTHGAFGSSWRDIKVYQNHAFIVSEANQHGMQVFDLTQLRSVTNPPVTFGETAHYRDNASAHNIVINEDSGYAYIVGASGKNSCSGGLHMVNIQNPTSPTFAGCYSADGYTHDAQCVIYNGPDAEHSGREICINANEDTVTIVDVSDKSNPLLISRTGYSGAEYTHQGWLTEDQSYYLLDDELDEQRLGHNTRTRIWDVSDLDSPSLVTVFDNTTPAIDHNQYVKGNFSYQANYRSGLRILDISDISSPTEVAYFDIYPADDAAEFNAAWSNYPYFASGTVVVSGIEQGLYVLKPTLSGGSSDALPDVTLTSPAEGQTVSGTITMTADASDDNGVDQVEFFVGGISVGFGTDDGTGTWSASWDSTTVSDGSHTVTAEATDTIGQTASDSNTITVDNGVADPGLHVGDLDATASSAGPSGKWDASVTVTVHDEAEQPLANATVTGSWDNDGSASCVTDGNGQCTVSQNNIHRNTASVTFTVTEVSLTGYVYDSTANHDPDGDSDGTSIVIIKP